MATWFIVPSIMATRCSNDPDFPAALRNAFGSFGIAWRLLDDIQDIESDLVTGALSSVYICLPEEYRRLWRDMGKSPTADTDRSLEPVIEYILEQDIIGMMRERISYELGSAAQTLRRYHLDGLANECENLCAPLSTPGNKS